MNLRRLRTLIVREIRATLRDPFTISILILVPLGTLLLFNAILTTEVRHVALGIRDASSSPASRRLIAELRAQGTFDAVPMQTQTALEEALRRGRVRAAIVIPPDFDRRLEGVGRGGRAPEIQAWYDGGEALLAANIEGYLRAIVGHTGATLVTGPGTGGSSGVSVTTRVLFNPTLDGQVFMVAGVYGFVFSFLTVLITAVSIVGERLAGTFDQLQVTPATSVEILLGKIVPLGAVFAFDVVLMALVAGFGLGVWPRGSLVFFLSVSTVYVLISLALGLIISATSATASEAVQRSVIFSIPLVQLSGFMYPIRSMPEPVQWLVEAFPATHYIRVSRAIYMRAAGPADLWGDLLFIGVVGVLLFAWAVRTLGGAHVKTFVSNVLAIAYKEARVLRHDRAVMSSIAAQPIVMLFLFGWAISNTPHNVPWLVLDRSDTAVSRRLVGDIQATGYFLPAERAASYDAARERMRRGQALVLVVIPSDFARQRAGTAPGVQVLLDGSEPLTAARVGAAIAQVGALFEFDAPDAFAAARAGPIDVRQRFRFNPTLSDSTFYLSVLGVILLTNLCLSASSLGLVSERENGTYEQMLALPTTPLEIVLGKLLPYVVVSYGVIVLATLLAGVVFGFWPVGSFVTLCVVALPFILAALGIGVFVSAISRTSAQAVFISVFFILPSFILSGLMMPYEFMPHPVREIGAVTPTRWFQIATRLIVTRGAGFTDVLGPYLVLWGMFGLILLAIRWRMKPRLG